MRKIILASIPAALAISPACARDWPDAGGWSVVETEGACGMSQTYEGKGESELLIWLDEDGAVGLSISNDLWSPVDGQKYEMDYFLNGTSYGGGSAVGSADGSKKGFVSRFDGTFLRDFAAGNTLVIYRGELLVDQLSLKGTAAGVAIVRRCMAAMKADKAAAERERQRLAHIVDDPFAVKQTELEKLQFGTNSAKPRGMPSAWVSDADYPSAAQRERRQGVTGYKLEVNADGQATSCVVTSSSGHPDLDEAACSLIPRRARFSTGGLYESKVTWRLPE